MLGLIGPLFAPVNPQNAQSTGFSAGQFGTGAMGADQRHPGRRHATGSPPTRCSSSPPPRRRCTRTGSARCRSSSRRVLGVQVAYAGYFAPLVISGAGIIKIVK